MALPLVFYRYQFFREPRVFLSLKPEEIIDTWRGYHKKYPERFTKDHIPDITQIHERPDYHISWAPKDRTPVEDDFVNAQILNNFSVRVHTSLFDKAVKLMLHYDTMENSLRRGNLFKIVLGSEDYNQHYISGDIMKLLKAHNWDAYHGEVDAYRVRLDHWEEQKKAKEESPTQPLTKHI